MYGKWQLATIHLGRGNKIFPLSTPAIAVHLTQYICNTNALVALVALHIEIGISAKQNAMKKKYCKLVQCN